MDDIEINQLVIKEVRSMFHHWAKWKLTPDNGYPGQSAFVVIAGGGGEFKSEIPRGIFMPQGVAQFEALLTYCDQIGFGSVIAATKIWYLTDKKRRSDQLIADQLGYDDWQIYRDRRRQGENIVAHHIQVARNFEPTGVT